MLDRRKKERKSLDRRFNNRVFVELDVTVRIDDKNYATKMRNLSGNGMQIMEPENIEIDPKQNCHILIKDRDNIINLDAAAVWKEFGLIGLCFKKQNQKTQKQLNKLSQRLLETSVANDDVANLA
jgi:hypothetical protein